MRLLRDVSPRSLDAAVTNDQLAAAFASKGVKAPVERVETIAWPHGGYVSEVKLRHAGGETTIEGPDFRVGLNAWSKRTRPEAFKDLEIKSTSFEVAADPVSPGTLVITGKGWGHGVGLCQWGAKGAADSGMDEDAILRRYYPGADIEALLERPVMVEAVVRSSSRGAFAQDITVRGHVLTGDVGKEAGGNDLGPDPHEMLLAALGECT